MTRILCNAPRTPFFGLLISIVPLSERSQTSKRCLSSDCAGFCREREGIEGPGGKTMSLPCFLGDSRKACFLGTAGFRFSCSPCARDCLRCILCSRRVDICSAQRRQRRRQRVGGVCGALRFVMQHCASVRDAAPAQVSTLLSIYSSSLTAGSSLAASSSITAHSSSAATSANSLREAAAPPPAPATAVATASDASSLEKNYRKRRAEERVEVRGRRRAAPSPGCPHAAQLPPGRPRAARPHCGSCAA